ncbi:MAG: hypothetical protein Q8O62_07520 [Aequorivita sp.]|nr:hypothetical protein [Aequorivita sp.]
MITRIHGSFVYYSVSRIFPVSAKPEISLVFCLPSKSKISLDTIDAIDTIDTVVDLFLGCFGE